MSKPPQVSRGRVGRSLDRAFHRASLHAQLMFFLHTRLVGIFKLFLYFFHLLAHLDVMFGQHLVDGLRARLEIVHDALVVLRNGKCYQLVYAEQLCIHGTELLLQRTQLITLHLGRMMRLLFLPFKVKHQALDLSNILDCYESSQPFKLMDKRTKDRPVTLILFRQSFHPIITSRRLDEILGENRLLIEKIIFRQVLGSSTS